LNRNSIGCVEYWKKIVPIDNNFVKKIFLSDRNVEKSPGDQAIGHISDWQRWNWGLVFEYLEGSRMWVGGWIKVGKFETRMGAVEKSLPCQEGRQYTIFPQHIP
jgi:hypothetical protein